MFMLFAFFLFIMEEHCSYQKWITKDKPDFYIRESEG